jgi:hypothetical protein
MGNAVKTAKQIVSETVSACAGWALVDVSDDQRAMVEAAVSEGMATLAIEAVKRHVCPHCLPLVEPIETAYLLEQRGVLETPASVCVVCDLVMVAYVYG